MIQIGQIPFGEPATCLVNEARKWTTNLAIPVPTLFARRDIWTEFPHSNDKTHCMTLLGSRPDVKQGPQEHKDSCHGGGGGEGAIGIRNTWNGYIAEDVLTTPGSSAVVDLGRLSSLLRRPINRRLIGPALTLLSSSLAMDLGDAQKGHRPVQTAPSGPPLPIQN